MRGFGFTYAGEDSRVLTDVDLELPAGSMTAVLGPVGSGTSTLSRALAGLLETRGTTTGRVDVTGTVGFLGDDPEAQLSGLTSRVADETQLACRLRGISPAAAEARAHDVLANLGIDDLWNRRLDTLSGGQRQLVALSRIASLDPDLLILDQPSQSLDPDMRRRLAGLLRENCERGGSALITGHQIDELTVACDEVRFLRAGDGLAQGSADGVRLAQSARAQGVWDTRPDHAAQSRSASMTGSRPAASTTADPELSTTAAAEPPRAEPVLSVRSLSVHRASRTVLDGVSVDLLPGELVTLTGANGAGKSTLLRGLIGLLGRSGDCTGTVTMSRLGEGTNLLDMPAHARSAHLGWVGQDPGIQLSAATVRSELMHAAPLPRHRRRERTQVLDDRRRIVDSVLHEVDLAAVDEEHPFDLDGPRRKDLVIASALVTGADVLLLDEPTIGRDQAGMNRLTAIIDRVLRRGGAVLATTHDPRWAAESSHRRLHLADGRVHSR
ncbi:ATP-binding cassette domain-containing protein [Brevibacterium oceani]|uniref:ATP-binding cassette domain-containing protein n=1 Tax=Brevibacterium oceani TaxID=358099 RepID=UPI0015E6C648|nr:ABC transporter ATP-binding protein [Brevibacterium oceani]